MRGGIGYSPCACACSCAGVNQLLSVFEPAWKADGEACYNDFSTLMFTDIVHRDRVGRFYNLPL